jgi:hypothetical protein
MKRPVIISIIFLSYFTEAQVFWTENFNNGCTTGCGVAGVNTGNGAWSVTNAVTVAEGASANRWYVSCAENGMPANTCGAACGANASLHISAIGALCGPPDCGAAYNAGGACTTSKRAESPTINTTGYSGITLAFNYIENGETTLDDASVYYSVDNGTTWLLLANTAKSSCCNILTNAPVACSNAFAGQGYWKAFSALLPATCDNIATLKVGFLWINNGNNAGKDPSIAIDDVTLSYTTLLPITLSEFEAKQNNDHVNLQWTTETEENFKGFSVERSDDAIGFYPIGSVNGHNNSNSKKHYSFIDKELNGNKKIYYYRLKMTDNDGSYQYSPLSAVYFYSSASGTVYTINSSNTIEITSGELKPFSDAGLYNYSGQLIRSVILSESYNSKNDTYEIPARDLGSGFYLLRTSGGESKTFKIIIP